jgi:hypothetical protein
LLSDANDSSGDEGISNEQFTSGFGSTGELVSDGIGATRAFGYGPDRSTESESDSITVGFIAACLAAPGAFAAAADICFRGSPTFLLAGSDHGSRAVEVDGSSAEGLGVDNCSKPEKPGRRPSVEPTESSREIPPGELSYPPSLPLPTGATDALGSIVGRPTARPLALSLS